MSSSNKDPNRYDRSLPPGEIRDAFAQAGRLSNAQFCERLEDLADDLIRKACGQKEFEQTSGNCTGGGSGAPPKVDLVVVIDTSGSMTDEATDLSNAAAAAISTAQQSCPSDLRVAWFGIEGIWAGTNFNLSYRNYLHGLGVSDAVIVGTPGDLEDGAAAVIDISDHYDWRPGAARIIFYLGDEALEGGDPQNAGDVAACTAAIARANAQGVKVFTYVGTGAQLATVTEYARLATSTGGQAFAAPIASVGGFEAVLEKVICGGIVEVCQKVEEPKIAPCLRLRWGDGPQDHLETDDTEIFCITVCNPYSNVMLKDFTLQVIVTDANGKPVPNQADGTPSVIIKPNFNICYGDIPPCNPDKPDQPSCVSREFVLINRGAIDGKYKVIVFYCFDACFTLLGFESAFELELVKS
ncbi:MAG TPA: hypothetical protein VGC66_09305 [Pyrinomonadaceae bacterium]|jgi:hypothetical protein